MELKPSSPSRLHSVRIFGAFLFFCTGICLATLGFNPAADSSRKAGPSKAERYMPVPGGERDDLERLEAFWSDRLTYPTGRFDPAWVRQAAATDRLVSSRTPFGAGTLNLRMTGPTAAEGLDPVNFTALGPKPLRMTGCSGCFDFGFTEGRVNDIVVDPTTTTNGSIVAYAATVGGGVWKTTNCCSSSTTWTVTTDDPLLSTINVDTLAIDPNNHNTIYAGTGDLNYGSFSMGSQGILKSTDAGATWTLLGADVFGPALPEPAGQFPQYNAVGKVRVDPNNSSNIVAGTKTGLYFSYDGGTNWTGPCTTNGFTSMRQDITGLALIDNGATTSVIAAVGVRGFATTVQYNLNQNGANGIYRGTLPASGCPTDFTSITTNANGWAGLNATTGTAYGGAGVGNQAGRIDIAVAPSDSNYIYAQIQAITPNTNTGCDNSNGCQLGAYRTTNGGVTWTQIPNSPGNSLTDCEGDPGDYNQNWYDQGIAVDPNNPNRVFFDTFEVWFWDGSPATAGLQWNDTTCGYNASSPNNGVHVDQHALAFVPGSSSILLAGNDGGINGTTNANVVTASADPTWFNMDGGLNTIEFYSGDISGNFANSANPQANGGSQDNGSMSVTFSGSPTGPVLWQTGKGGDGFYARIDPVGTGSSLRFFQGTNSGGLSRCVSNCTTAGAGWTSVRGNWTGDTQSFILPFDLFHGGIPGGDDCPGPGIPGGCGHLIAGTTRVWETVSGGAASMFSSNWYVTNNPATQNMTKQTLGNRSFINQVKYSPKLQSVAMVGTNDGNVWIGFNLGTGTATQANWVNVTAGNVVLPNRPVLGIALDPSVATPNIPIGYAAVGGFNENTPGTPGHVFRVVCNADCTVPVWQNKTGNLPNIPVDSIIVNPNLPTQVFAGTDWGLYFTDDITAAAPVWSRFENGLPHTMVWDLQIDRGSTTLSVWTRGRGAYVWPLPSGPIASPTPTVTASPSPTPTPAQLLNISTRTRVMTGDNILIGGFIISGNDPKKVLVLAKGPSMSSGGNPVPGRLSNPTLEVHASDGTLIESNDDWQDSPERTEIENSGFAPADIREAAILRTLSPGAYTGVLAGKDNATGIALIEIYDFDANKSLLTNISSRGSVDTGDNVMIGGFIAGNQNGNTKVLVRGLGPSLQGQVPNPLSDPILELHDANGATLETNDNWRDSPNRTEIEATGIAPGNDLESAILRVVSPAGYTAILRGKTGSGIAVVEIYNLN